MESDSNARCCFRAALLISGLLTGLAHGQTTKLARTAGVPEHAVVAGNAELENAKAGDCVACGFNAGFPGGGELALAAAAPSRGQFYAGAEYLSVRATFSEASAFIQTTADPAPPAAATTLITEFVPLSFNYDGSYRVFGGYRLPECGGQFEFGFTNYQSDASATSPVVVAGSGVSIISPSSDVAVPDGSALVTVGSVDAQAFDFGFSKTIPLGSPPDCGGCCDTECGSCCGGWCPAWDITWSGGLRYADVDWSIGSTLDPVPLGGAPTSTTRLDFNGFGARFGLEGRRYFGRSQWLSLFVDGDISLLLGDLTLSQELVTPATGALSPTVNSALFSTTQIVPVTDIQLGATAQLTSSSTVTVGYLLSAWHDLGNRSTDALDPPPAAAIADQSFDDANILGFDGFFVRGEFFY